MSAHLSERIATLIPKAGDIIKASNASAEEPMPKPWPEHIKTGDPARTLGWPEFPSPPLAWYWDRAKGDWVPTDPLNWRELVEGDKTPCFDRGLFGESPGLHGLVAVRETEDGRLYWVEAHLATAALAAGWVLGPRPGRIPPSRCQAAHHGQVPAGLAS